MTSVQGFCIGKGLLVVIEVFELALLDPAEQDRDLVGMKFTDHLCLLAAITSLHTRFHSKIL